MELYKNLFEKNDDILESLNFAISQFEKSKLTLSSIQHKKVLSDIDMDFEELIGILLSSKSKIEELSTSNENSDEEQIITSKIAERNVDGLCSQEHCDDKPTRFFEMNINNQKLIIPLCDRHSAIIENANFDECLEPPIIECDADKDGIHYKFYCKYCGEYHNHGAGEGHRVSHCIQPSPYKNTGYILKLKNKDLNSKEVL